MSKLRDLAAPRTLRILLPIGLVVAAICGWQWLEQRAALRNAVAVDAVIVSADVEEWTSGTGARRERNYRPVVRFRFALDGIEHESNRVTPLADSGSASWARELIGRFAPGARTTAWVDPAAPERAFLVRTTSWRPPAGTAAGLLVALAAGFGLWRHRGRARANAIP